MKPDTIFRRTHLVHTTSEQWKREEEQVKLGRIVLMIGIEFMKERMTMRIEKLKNVHIYTNSTYFEPRINCSFFVSFWAILGMFVCKFKFLGKVYIVSRIQFLNQWILHSWQLMFKRNSVFFIHAHTYKVLKLTLKNIDLVSRNLKAYFNKRSPKD